MRVFGRMVFGRLGRACLALACGLVVATAHAADDEWIYAMRPGDTLIGIAEQNFTDPADWPIVQKRNRIADPYRIPAGTLIRIPVRLLRPDPTAATVLLVNGQAYRAQAEGGNRQPLAVGDMLRAGDGVQVAGGSNLSLRFPDGSRLLVLEKTRFVLRRSARLGTSGRHQIEIELSEGSIESSVASTSANARPQYEIRTPALRMAVRGTHFRAMTDSVDGSARSEVLAGRVRLSGARKSITLSAGFGSMAAAGKAPQPARQLMPAPELLDPPTRIERLPLHFGWTQVADAHFYRAQILDRDMNLVRDGVYSGTVVRWPELADGEYTLRVRAIGGDRLEGLDVEHRFTVDTLPEPPFARSPSGKVYGDSARFDWTAGAAGNRYHFQLAADAAFTQLLNDEPLLTETGFTRSLPPGTYYWRVGTVDAAGDHGPFGDAIAIDLYSVPASPAVDEPEIGDEQLRFSWRDGGRGETYRLQLARMPDFSDLVLEQTTRNASVSLPRPAAGEYYLRVQATEADGFTGPFGATQRFTVPAATPWWLLFLLVPLAL